MFVCTSVIPVVFYLLTGLAGYCSVGPGINRSARKLTQTPRVIKKKEEEEEKNKFLSYFFHKKMYQRNYHHWSILQLYVIYMHEFANRYHVYFPSNPNL